MNDSREVPLRELLETVIDHRGKTPKKLGGEFSLAGVSVISARNVKDGRLVFDDVRFVSRQIYDKWMPVKLAEGDVVLTSEAPLGEVAFLKGDVEYCLGQRLFALRPDRSKLHPRFLYYVLRSALGQARLHARLTGTTVQGIRQSELVKVTVPVPAVHDQVATATILGTLDDKIELNRRMTATAHELAHAIFRLRYRSDDSQLPHEPLGEHVEVARGLSYTGAGLADEGVPLHNLDSIVEGGGYNRHGIKHYRGAYKEKHLVRPGDVIVANTDLTWNYRVIASPARVPAAIGNTNLFSHHLHRVRPKPASPLSSQFVYLMLLPGRLRSEIAGYANGTTVNMLPVEALQKPRFAVPPRALVEEIDALVTPLFERAEAAEDESETLAQLRDTLLPKLISGELRLRAAD